MIMQPTPPIPKKKKKKIPQVIRLILDYNLQYDIVFQNTLPQSHWPLLRKFKVMLQTAHFV